MKTDVFLILTKIANSDYKVYSNYAFKDFEEKYSYFYKHLDIANVMGLIKFLEEKNLIGESENDSHLIIIHDSKDFIEISRNIGQKKSVEFCSSIDLFLYNTSITIQQYNPNLVLEKLVGFQKKQQDVVKDNMELMNLMANNDVFGTNEGNMFVDYIIDINVLCKKLSYKKLPDPFHINKIEKSIKLPLFYNYLDEKNKNNTNIKKFLYLLDIYEGFLIINSAKLSMDAYQISKLKIISERIISSEEIVISFQLFKYLLMNNYIIEIKIDSIFITPRVFIYFKNQFEFIDVYNYSSFMKKYVDDYTLILLLELFKDVNMDQNKILNIRLKDFTFRTKEKISSILLKEKTV